MSAVTDLAIQMLKREIALTDRGPAITFGTAVFVRNIIEDKELYDLQEGRPKHFTAETWEGLVMKAAEYARLHPEGLEALDLTNPRPELFLGTFRLNDDVGGVTDFDLIWKTSWTHDLGGAR